MDSEHGYPTALCLIVIYVSLFAMISCLQIIHCVNHYTITLESLLYFYYNVSPCTPVAYMYYHYYYLLLTQLSIYFLYVIQVICALNMYMILYKLPSLSIKIYLHTLYEIVHQLQLNQFSLLNSYPNRNYILITITNYHIMIHIAFILRSTKLDYLYSNSFDLIYLCICIHIKYRSLLMYSHNICLMRPVRLVALHSHYKYKCCLQSITSSGYILHSIIRTLLYITVFINMYINTIHVCTHMFSTSNGPMYCFLFSTQIDIYDRRYYWIYTIVLTTLISANRLCVNNTCNLYLFYSMTHVILQPRKQNSVLLISNCLNPYIDILFIYYIICILSKMCIIHVYTLKLLLHLKSDQIRNRIIFLT